LVFTIAIKMSSSDFWDLFFKFCSLSVVAVGGALATAGDMHRYLVDERQWMSSGQFADSIALAQIAPGPNILFVTLLGLQVGGPLGAVATTIGILLPSSVMTFYSFRMRARYQNTPLMRAIATGLAPLALGMIAATGMTLSKAADTNWLWALVTFVTVILVVRTKINPLWLLAIGALLGLFKHAAS
jgi:chromate transporter